MRKLLMWAIFVCGLVAITATSVFSKDYSQKTHLTPRAVGVNLPMEKSIWHDYSYQKLDLYVGHKVRSHFAVTGFYQSNTEKHEIGKYFGIGNDNGNHFKVGPTSDTKKNIDGNYFIHYLDSESGDPTSPLAGSVSFEPKHEIWGARLDFFQDIDHPCKNIFFRASMPVVYVENNMGMEIEEGASVKFGNKSFSLADFFAGNVEVTEAMDDNNIQSPLKKSKIDGKRTKTGLGDIELGLGYKCYQTKKAHIFLSLGLTIPVETDGHGEYLWEPVTGNGDHVGFGVRLDSGIKLWEGKKSVVRALFDLDYHYLFEASEHRMVKPKDSVVSGFFSQYYLAGLKNQYNQPLFPAANFLTQNCRVEPGSQFDGMLALSFKSSGFVIDLGYNFYYKDEERVWLKDWEDGIYAIATTGYNPRTERFSEDGDVTVGGFLNKDSLDIDSAKTPSQFTNKIFAGLGYQCNIAKKYPSLVGIGGSYEFANDNSALEQYALWLKLGISF